MDCEDYRQSLREAMFGNQSLDAWSLDALKNEKQSFIDYALDEFQAELLNDTYRVYRDQYVLDYRPNGYNLGRSCGEEGCWTDDDEKWLYDCMLDELDRVYD